MNQKNRKKQLEQLIKEATLDKVAEDTITDVNDLGIADPEAYADNIFDTLINNLTIDLDDA